MLRYGKEGKLFTFCLRIAIATVSWGYTYIHTVCLCVCVSTCDSKGLTLGCLPHLLTYLIIYDSLSMSLEVRLWLDCLASDNPGPACLWSQALGIWMHTTHSACQVGAEDLNSSLHAWAPSPLATETPLQPCY